MPSHRGRAHLHVYVEIIRTLCAIAVPSGLAVSVRLPGSVLTTAMIIEIAADAGFFSW